jgi:hypothetical protein
MTLTLSLVQIQSDVQGVYARFVSSDVLNRRLCYWSVLIVLEAEGASIGDA